MNTTLRRTLALLYAICILPVWAAVMILVAVLFVPVVLTLFILMMVGGLVALALGLFKSYDNWIENLEDGPPWLPFLYASRIVFLPHTLLLKGIKK